MARPPTLQDVFYASLCEWSTYVCRLLVNFEYDRCAVMLIKACLDQAEACAALGRYREAETALREAARKDATFAQTKEYKSLTMQLAAHLQRLG